MSVLITSLLLLFGQTPNANAEDMLDTIRTFDIAPGALDAALIEFSRQAQVAVSSDGEALRPFRTPGIRSRESARSALAKLLGGSGFTFRVVKETVQITPDDSAQPAAEAGKRRSNARTGGTETSADSAPRNPLIDEVIVTAQRREEVLQDVPISIAVLSGLNLDMDTGRGLSETLTRVPGMAIDTSVYGGGSSSLTVRGVAAGAAVFTGASPVGYYLDSVPFGFVKSAFVPDANVYDLERIEALRGPQGTLYGAGSQNGVVRILTMNADLEDYEIKSRLSLSHTDSGDINYRGDAALNVPIIEGKLGARGVIGYQKLSGWINKPIGKNENEGEMLNARLKLNAAPTENLSVGLSAWMSRTDFGAPNFSPDGDTHPSLVNEPRSSDFDTYSLKVDYKFASVSLTSMTSYIDYVDNVQNDLAPAGLPDTILYLYFPARTFAQEFNLGSAHVGPWRWTAGAIYRDSEDRLDGWRRQYFAPVNQTFNSRSHALFGEVTRQLMDGRLELTAGLRYFEDEVTEREDSRLDTLPPTGVYAHNKFDAWTPRVVVNWHQSEAMTAYASYAEGFRSGSAQNPLVLTVMSLPPVRPDTLRNYETGIKGNLMSKRVDYELAAYYIDWEGVQQLLLIPSGGFNLNAVVNGTSASGVGVDFGLSVLATDRLEFGLTANWNDLTFNSDVYSGGVLLFDGSDRLNSSPEWTASGSASYGFPLGRLEARLSASANYTSARSITSLAGTTRTVDRGDSLLVGSAAFAVDSSDHWSLSLFVDNVTNENGKVSILQLPASISRIRPRTIGMQFEYRR